MRLTTRDGFTAPLWLEDYIAYLSIATTAYDPIATYQASAKTEANLATMNAAVLGGFMVQNITDTAGYIYAITLAQFKAYQKANKGLTPATWDLSGIVPRKIQIDSYDWAYTPLVKVFADNHGSYASTVTSIQVGRIL